MSRQEDETTQTTQSSTGDKATILKIVALFVFAIIVLIGVFFLLPPMKK